MFSKLAIPGNQDSFPVFEEKQNILKVSDKIVDLGDRQVIQFQNVRFRAQGVVMTHKNVAKIKDQGCFLVYIVPSVVTAMIN